MTDTPQEPIELKDDLATLTEEFSTDEQNAAAWLALILLTAENRAALEGLRNLLVEKEIATVEEIDKHLIEQLEQPTLSNWYNMMHQLYAYRVHETLQIQKNKRESGEEDIIKETTDQNITPTGPPPADFIKEEAIQIVTEDTDNES